MKCCFYKKKWRAFKISQRHQRKVVGLILFLFLFNTDCKQQKQHHQGKGKISFMKKMALKTNSE